MKKLSETYKELGIDFTFPIEIEDARGNETYFENSDGFWWKSEYNAHGEETYYEDSEGYWWKRECNAHGEETYFEDSDGYKDGIPRSQLASQSCAGKIVEVDGKKYKLTEL